MRKKVHIKEMESKLSEKGETIKTNQKIHKKSSRRIIKKLEKKNNKINKFRELLTKVNITYFILILLDIILVIYSARQNIVNYVKVMDQEIFVSKTRYLLFGRNYINLIITLFFYVYICLINRFFLQRKNTKKFLFWLFVLLVILNLGLFLVFTKRVY